MAGGRAKSPADLLHLFEEHEPHVFGDGDVDPEGLLLPDALGFPIRDNRAIVDPVLHNPGPMYTYEPGTWGPSEADALVADVGGWNTEG